MRKPVQAAHRRRPVPQPMKASFSGWTFWKRAPAGRQLGEHQQAGRFIRRRPVPAGLHHHLPAPPPGREVRRSCGGFDSSAPSSPAPCYKRWRWRESFAPSHGFGLRTTRSAHSPGCLMVTGLEACWSAGSRNPAAVKGRVLCSRSR